MADVSKNCKTLVTPIKALQKINSDIFGDLNAYELKGQMERSVVMVSRILIPVSDECLFLCKRL